MRRDKGADIAAFARPAASAPRFDVKVRSHAATLSKAAAADFLRTASSDISDEGLDTHPHTDADTVLKSGERPLSRGRSRSSGSIAVEPSAGVPSASGKDASNPSSPTASTSPATPTSVEYVASVKLLLLSDADDVVASHVAELTLSATVLTLHSPVRLLTPCACACLTTVQTFPPLTLSVALIDTLVMRKPSETVSYLFVQCRVRLLSAHARLRCSSLDGGVL